LYILGKTVHKRQRDLGFHRELAKIDMDYLATMAIYIDRPTLEKVPLRLLPLKDIYVYTT